MRGVCKEHPSLPNGFQKLQSKHKFWDSNLAFCCETQKDCPSLISCIKPQQATRFVVRGSETLGLLPQGLSVCPGDSQRVVTRAFFLTARVLLLHLVY